MQLSHQAKCQVVELYRSGATMCDCSTRFGTSQTTVSNILRKMAPDAIRPRRHRINESIVVPEMTGSSLDVVLSYDPETGIFRHKTYRGPRSDGPGSIAGAVMDNGYVTIGFFQTKILAHRLAWLWMTGGWPSQEIDHINGDRSDNRFANLRLATRSQNCQNGGIRSTNTTGRIGVSFDQRRGKYVARLVVNGRTIFQKRFPTLEEAVRARAVQEQVHYGEFAPGHHIGRS